MSARRILYILLTAIIAGTAALFGAAAGGIAVYRAVQLRSSLPTAVQQALAASSTSTTQSFALNSTDIQTAVTQAVQRVGPAVVTVVGTVPGQQGFFGQTSDQTVRAAASSSPIRATSSRTTTSWKGPARSASCSPTAHRKRPRSSARTSTTTSRC